MRLVTILAVLAVVSSVPANPVAGQVAYSPEPGPFVVGSPVVRPYLGAEQSAWWAGVGWRMAGGTDLAVRVGRGESAPYGAPLEDTSVDHTVVEVRTTRLTTGTSADDGILVALAALATVEDRSRPIAGSGADGVRFREGARLSDYGGRIELYRVWRWGSPRGFNVHPRIGVLGQYRRTRGGTVLREPEGIEEPRAATGDFAGGAVFGLGFSLRLGGLGRLYVQPRIEGEIGSDFLSSLDVGAAAGLNF